MRRRLFNVLTLLSLLLCATAAALWYRTRSFTDQWDWHTTIRPDNGQVATRRAWIVHHVINAKDVDELRRSIQDPGLDFATTAVSLDALPPLEECQDAAVASFSRPDSNAAISRGCAVPSRTWQCGLRSPDCESSKSRRHRPDLRPRPGESSPSFRECTPAQLKLK